MPTVVLPAPLRPLAGGHARVEAAGTTVAEVLDTLVAAHPAIGDRLRDADGRLHRFVNVFVGDDDVRDLRGLATTLAPDDEVTVVPAVAGG